MARGLVAFVLGALLPVLVIGCGARSAEATRQAKAWELTCQIMEEDCSDIVQPKVVYTGSADADDKYGVYASGPAIEVAASMRGDPDSILVMVHEMVHYIQVNSHGKTFPMPRWKACLIEEEAFEVEWKAAGILNLRGSGIAMEWKDAKHAYKCP